MTNKETGTKLPPAILTIFGITGDLSSRKLLPSLYYMADDNMLPPVFKIVGVTRRGTTPAEVIEAIRKAVQQQGRTCRNSTLKKLEESITIIKMDITDLGEYGNLKTKLDDIEKQAGLCLNRLFYLAMPSQVFAPVVRLLGNGGLNQGCQHGRAESRLLIEKPLGYDLTSAAELIEAISAAFKQQQLYLIDHYLAKTSVQDLINFRLTNTEFEPFWNKDHIKQIIITADETIGIEGRVIFYEQMGALRDVVQSHLLQLLSLVAMDKPKETSASAIHAAKLSLLNCVVPPAPDTINQVTVRGQYDGYGQEVENPDSVVETFAAVKLQINNKRWQGVPVILRTGKKLASKSTKVSIVFKDKFKTLDLAAQTGQRNDYEQVIAGALAGNKALFASKEEILASWRIIEPILNDWANDRTLLSPYKSGSDGPSEYNKLTKL